MNMISTPPLVLVRRSKDAGSFIRKAAKAGRIFLAIDAPGLTTSETKVCGFFMREA